MLLGAVYINLHSSTRSDAEVSQMLLHMQHRVSEAQSRESQMSFSTNDPGGGLQCTF